MKHKSFTRELIEDVILTPFYMMKLGDSSETVILEFYESFMDNYRRRVSDLSVSVQSKQIDIYECTLNIHAHFTGLSYLMYHHPVLSSCLGISSISTVVFTLLFFFWKKVFEPSVVVAISKSNSQATLAQKQELARERLSKSSSQQKILKKVAENAAVVEDVSFTIGQSPDGEESSIRKRCLISSSSSS